MTYLNEDLEALAVGYLVRGECKGLQQKPAEGSRNHKEAETAGSRGIVLMRYGSKL